MSSSQGRRYFGYHGHSCDDDECTTLRKAVGQAWKDVEGFLIEHPYAARDRNKQLLDLVSIAMERSAQFRNKADKIHT